MCVQFLGGAFDHSGEIDAFLEETRLTNQGMIGRARVMLANMPSLRSASPASLARDNSRLSEKTEMIPPAVFVCMSTR